MAGTVGFAQQGPKVRIITPRCLAPRLENQRQSGGDEERLRQRLGRLRDDDRGRSNVDGARIAQHRRTRDLTTDRRGGRQVVDRIAGHAETNELTERESAGVLTREREAPPQRVQQVRDGFLPEDQRQAPSHLQQRGSHDVHVDLPHQDAKAQRPQAEQHLLSGRHRARWARTPTQRLIQNRFAPMAALHTNHSSRSNAARTITR